MIYIDQLTEEQRLNFLITLAHVMHADGEVNGDEHDFIEVAARAYDVPESQATNILQKRDHETVATLAATITDTRARRYLIREMISLGLSDGELADEELDAIFAIGESLGLSEERMEDMVSWAVEGMEWQLDGFRLVEEDDNKDHILEETTEEIDDGFEMDFDDEFEDDE